MFGNATSFVLGTRSAAYTQVVDLAHPPVIRAMQVLADQGELRYGTLVVQDANRKIIQWDGTTGSPMGVLVETIDTALENTARVLVHGIVKKDSLWVMGATPDLPTAAQLALLDAQGIWATQGEL